VTLKFPKSDKYNFTRNMVKNYRLVTYLDRFLAKEPAGFTFTYEAKEKDDAWHPSGHCTPPPTVLFDHAVHQEEHQFDVAMLKTFAVGHFWHQLLQYAVVKMDLAEPEAIERKGIRVWQSEHHHEQCSMNCVGGHSEDCMAWKIKETVPLPWQWAPGAGDVAPLVLPDWMGVVDFKTMSSHQFKGVEKGGVLPDWCAHKYEAQINIYMDFFDQENGLIVAVQKDSPHAMAEVEFRRNQELIDAIYDKWEFVSECLAAEERPSELDDGAFDFTDLYTGPVTQ
jgi:hypothetical protein